MAETTGGDTRLATFVLELRQEDKNREIESYSFYVPPSDVDIATPARLTLYQTIDGSTHIDHLGSGVTSITLSGSTGWTFGNAFKHPFAYHSYALLRHTIDKYFTYCKNGYAKKDTLVLYIDTPDAPNFGQWNVSVKQITLKRSASQPLLFMYSLQLVCLSENLAQFDYDTQNAMMSKLVATKINNESPKKEKPAVTSVENITTISSNSTQYSGPPEIYSPEDVSLKALNNNRSIIMNTVETEMKKDFFETTIIAGTTEYLTQKNTYETLHFGPQMSAKSQKNYAKTSVSADQISSTIASIQSENAQNYAFDKNSSSSTIFVFNYTKTELVKMIFGPNPSPRLLEMFYKANPEINDAYDKKIKIARETKDYMLKNIKAKLVTLPNQKNKTEVNPKYYLENVDKIQYPKLTVYVPSILMKEIKLDQQKTWSPIVSKR